MRKREERTPDKRTLDRCKCEACKRAKGQPHKIAFGRVHDYSASPIGGWQVHTTWADLNEYALGVELETSAPPGIYDEDDEGGEDIMTHCRAHGWEYDLSDHNTSYWSRWDRAQLPDHNENCAAPYNEPRIPGTVYVPPVSSREAADMARPKEFWLPKHDGSVTGPEFASHPATLVWWYAHRADLTEMFTMLLHSGYRSHEGDQAGMHVNISTSAFGNKRVITEPLPEPEPEYPPFSSMEILRLEMARNNAYDAWNVATEAYQDIRSREFPDALTQCYNSLVNFVWLDEFGNPVLGDSPEAHHIGPTTIQRPVRPEPSEEHERLRHAEESTRMEWYERDGEYQDARQQVNEWNYERNERREPVDVYEGAEEHLRRFIDLVYVNKQWSRRMSQRSVNSLHWCQLDLLDDDDRRGRWVKRAIREGYSNDDRYLAVNRPDEHRFEFRLPRGTLRLDRFYKNLEWTHSMIEYTRIADALDCTPPKYMAWVLRNEAYPYLRAFLEERFPSQIERQKLKVVK